eukprot:7229984-Prorocentrum_lima.AAC.1
MLSGITTSYVPLVRSDIGDRAGGVTPGHVDAAATCGFVVKACGTVCATGSCPYSQFVVNGVSMG